MFCSLHTQITQRHHQLTSMASRGQKRRKAASSSSPTDTATHGLADYHFDKSDSVTLIVGPEKHELLAHGNFIARRSAFFEAALKEEWLEGQTRSIALPEDDHETVTDYLKFTYSGKLVTSLLEANIMTKKKETLDAHFLQLAKLYVLGTKLMDNEVRTAVVRELHGIFVKYFTLKSSCLPNHHFVDIIYNGTTTRDPVRVLLVWVYLSHCQGTDLGQTHHQEFALELLKSFATLAEENI